MHRKLPSFSFSSRNSSTTSLVSDDEDVKTPRPSSKSRPARSASPFRWSRARSDARSEARSEVGEGNETEDGGLPGGESEIDLTEADESESERQHSKGSSSTPRILVRNAFDSSDTGESTSETDSDDETLERNTEANANFLEAARDISISSEMVYPGEGPNLLPASELAFAYPTVSRGSRPLRRRSTKTRPPNAPLPLVASAPIFELNRATVVLTHGDPDKANLTGRRRRYLVASDLSKESGYAIEWSVGTLLRDGDELIVVSVLETDSKFDGDEHSASDKKAKLVYQRERQMNALTLSREVTSLLERTRLNVRVPCQVIHDSHPRRLLLDMIDYYEPTLVVLGTRGWTNMPRMLLGSVSNYLLQKSSSPVMVTRRPLRRTRTVDQRRSKSTLNREPRMRLQDAATEKASHGGAQVGDDPEGEHIAEEIRKMEISRK